MANTVQVGSIQDGRFYVKGSEGQLIEIKSGDEISIGDTIVADESNSVFSSLELRLGEESQIIAVAQGAFLLDSSLFDNTFANEEKVFEGKAVDEVLAAWTNQGEVPNDNQTASGDVTEEETAAGEEVSQDGGALRSVFSARDGDSTNVISDLRRASFSGDNDNDIDGTDNMVLADSVITLAGSIVNEGENITITATVAHPPQTDLIISLSNGQTITILAGQTTGSVTFANLNTEDVYKDGETFEVSITSTIGGNYNSLDISSKAIVTVNDTENTTTVTLTGSTVNEGADVTITANVDNAPQTDFNITLDNGQTITILAGQTTGSVTFTNPNAEDVYVDGGSFNVSIASTSGGNYEKLDTNIVATVKVTDTIDTVTVNLSASTVEENAGDTSYVFTATLSHPSQGITTIETDKGTITIADGQTVGTLVIASNQVDDVYKDASELTAKITSATGGNFEN